jgi:DNA end-binding protein Ku
MIASKVRSFADIAKAKNAKLSTEEIELGADLIGNMSDGFNPDKYRDEYRERVQAMLDEKSKGQEMTLAAPDGSPLLSARTMNFDRRSSLWLRKLTM